MTGGRAHRAHVRVYIHARKDTPPVGHRAAPATHSNSKTGIHVRSCWMIPKTPPCWEKYKNVAKS